MKAESNEVFLHIISHKSRFIKALKREPDSKLKGLATAITKELEDRKKQKKAEQAQIRKNKKEAARLVQLVEASGLTLPELMTIADSKKSRGPVPAKYRIVDDGKEHTWTGRGVTPKVFRELVEENRLHEVLISKD